MKTPIFILGMTLALPIMAQTAPIIRPKPQPTPIGVKVERRTINPIAKPVADRLLRMGGDGTRGGGETIDLNGHPELRDLVDNTTCDWKTGEEVYPTVSYTEQILKNLEKLDWYFALAIRQELKGLEFCQTGPLARVKTEDYDSITAVVEQGTSQVAIRLADSVYIDMSIFNRMSDRSKGYTMVHEAMHSFLNIGESTRNHKLRSMIKSLEGLETGRLATRQALRLQMSRNSIQFPQTVEKLNRQAIQFALGTFEERKAILAAEASPAQLLERVSEIDSANLWPFHRETVQFTNIESVVGQAVFLDSVEVLANLVRSPELRRPVVGLAYSFTGEYESPKVQEWLKTQATVDQVAGLMLTELTRREAVVRDGKIYITYQDFIAQSATAATPASSLVAVPRTEIVNIAPEIASYLGILKNYLAAGDLVAARALTTQNEDFYRAFEINHVSASVRSLTGVNEQEREIVLRNLRALSIGFWNYAQLDVFTGEAAANWEIIKKEINYTQLGYKF